MKLSKQFPLNAMRVFESVARHGSFTRAAEELGMTQTAVSYQIKLLEENLGQQLFLRRPRQIRMTGVAERILPDVTKAFDLLNEAASTARRASNETLEIRSAPTFGANWLARRLGDFQLQNPSIAVRLIRSSKLTQFDRDSADIAIRWGNGPWPELECHFLGRFVYAPMMNPKLLEKTGKPERPEDLLKLPIIGANDQCWREWFAVAGVENPDLSGHRAYEFMEQDLCANTALAGLGVAILDRIYFLDELATGRLVEPFDIYCSEGRALWLVYPPARRNIPKIKAFREWILQSISKDVARSIPANASSYSFAATSSPAGE